MKIVERIKKCLMVIGTFLLTVPTKVFATTRGDIDIAPAYGIPASVESKNNMLNIFRMFIIPIVLLIGIIIYLKKSKSSKKKKILITIGIIAITAILYFIIDKIYMN